MAETALDCPPSEITAANLGFETTPGGWRKVVGSRSLDFRRLRERADLEQTERLQRDVFGVSERDLASFSILVVVHKTGGEVLGAFDGPRLVGFISGYGGYVAGKPLLVSDFMAVEPAYRGGLGYAIKTLQGAVALAAGFENAIWTVDPLRAANARLNFERLGALSDQYTRDVYGSDFAEGLYGGMPSDRLTIRWPLTSHACGGGCCSVNQCWSRALWLDARLRAGAGNASCARGDPA